MLAFDVDDANACEPGRRLIIVCVVCRTSQPFEWQDILHIYFMTAQDVEQLIVGDGGVRRMAHDFN